MCFYRQIVFWPSMFW